MEYQQAFLSCQLDFLGRLYLLPPLSHPVSPMVRGLQGQGVFFPLWLAPYLFLANVSALNSSLFLYPGGGWTYNSRTLLSFLKKTKSSSSSTAHPLGNAQILSSEATFHIGGTIRSYQPQERKIGQHQEEWMAKFSKAPNLAYSSSHFQRYQQCQ